MLLYHFILLTVSLLVINSMGTNLKSNIAEASVFMAPMPAYAMPALLIPSEWI